MTGQKEEKKEQDKEEKEEKKEEKNFLRADGRMGGPTNGSTRGPRGPKNALIGKPCPGPEMMTLSISSPAWQAAVLGQCVRNWGRCQRQHLVTNLLRFNKY